MTSRRYSPSDSVMSTVLMMEIYFIFKNFICDGKKAPSLIGDPSTPLDSNGGISSDELQQM